MNKRFRLSFLCVLLLFFLATTANAQRTVGVDWQLPASESRALRQLHQFQKMGISVLQLKKIPSEKIWKEIEKQNISVIGDLGIRFPTAQYFASSDSSFIKQLRNKTADFLAQPPVIGINLFQYGALHQPEFGKATNVFFDSFKKLPPAKLFITDSRIVPEADLPAGSLLYDIRINPGNIQSLTIPDDKIIGGYKYSPKKELGHLLTPVKAVFELTENQPKKPLFFDSRWLLSLVDRHPRFKKTIQSIATDANPVFPLPDESLPSKSQSPLAIIVLIIIWGMLAYHYHISPLYRKSLFRYFNGHRFFLDDIYQRHIRSPFHGLMILIQHALLFSATIFALSTTVWSALSLNCMIEHYPSLFFLTNSRYDIFIIAFCLTILFYLISVLTLYISHKSMRSITQILTLFAWPLQLNFVIGTAAIAVHISGGSIYVTAILATLMLIVLLGAFVITAIDAAQFLKVGRLRYFALTAGIYTIVLLIFCLWLFGYNEYFWEVINLSLRLK